LVFSARRMNNGIRPAPRTSSPLWPGPVQIPPPWSIRARLGAVSMHENRGHVSFTIVPLRLPQPPHCAPVRRAGRAGTTPGPLWVARNSRLMLDLCVGRFSVLPSALRAVHPLTCCSHPRSFPAACNTGEPKHASGLSNMDNINLKDEAFPFYLPCLPVSLLFSPPSAASRSHGAAVDIISGPRKSCSGPCIGDPFQPSPLVG